MILTLSMNYAPVFFSNYAAYSSGKVDAANIEPVGAIAIDPITVFNTHCFISPFTALINLFGLV